MTTVRGEYGSFWRSCASFGIGGFLGALSCVFRDEGPIHWEAFISTFVLLPAWVVVTTVLLRDVKQSSIYAVILCASYLVGYELVWHRTHGRLFDDLYFSVPIQAAAYCLVAFSTELMLRRFGRTTGA